MFLRFLIKQPVFLYSTWENDLNPTATFQYKGFDVSIQFYSGEITKATKPGPLINWYREARGIEVTLQGSETSKFIAKEAAVALHELLILVSQRILRVIRNAAVEPDLPETLPSPTTTEKELAKWEPEISTDGESWEKLYPVPENPSERWELGFGLFGVSSPEGLGRSAELWARDWRQIAELLEDNEEPSPEDEFLTNTKGHIRGVNYRLAVVDAVIGLEIVLTRFMETYLTVVKRMPRSRVKKFLRTDLGLTARLSGLLDLTVHESHLKKLDIESALTVVEWRNAIVHKTGRLPEGVPGKKLVKEVDGVLKIARTLAEIQRDIKHTPFKIDLIRKIAAIHPNIVVPQIWFQAGHEVLIVVGYLPPYPKREDMEKLAKFIGESIRAEDKRFDPSTNLDVIFETSDEKRLGTYSFGDFCEPGNSPMELFNKSLEAKPGTRGT